MAYGRELERDRRIAQFHLQSLLEGNTFPHMMIRYPDIEKYLESINVALPKKSIVLRYAHEEKQWKSLFPQYCTALFIGRNFELGNQPFAVSSADTTIEIAKRIKPFDQKTQTDNQQIPTLLRLAGVHNTTRKVVAATYSLEEDPVLIEANISSAIPTDRQNTPSEDGSPRLDNLLTKLFVPLPAEMAANSYDTAGVVTPEMLDQAKIFNVPPTDAVVIHTQSDTPYFGRYGENNPMVEQLAHDLGYFIKVENFSIMVGQKKPGVKHPIWAVSLPLRLTRRPSA